MRPALLVLSGFTDMYLFFITVEKLGTRARRRLSPNPQRNGKMNWERNQLNVISRRLLNTAKLYV